MFALEDLGFLDTGKHLQAQVGPARFRSFKDEHCPLLGRSHITSKELHLKLKSRTVYNWGINLDFFHLF